MGYYLKFIIGRLKAVNYDIKNTIIISGSPRGGTTWLAETLNTIPGSSILWEPLGLQYVPTLEKMGFDWRTYISPDTEWAEAENYLGNVVRGRVLTRGTLSRASLAQMIQTKYWIVKFCRANMLLKWLTDRFCTRTPILLIRHPCAVVLSQMRHGGWDDPGGSYYPGFYDKFIPAYPQFYDLLKNLRSREEMLAATWCMEYYVPLSQPKPHPWVLVPYERLVRYGSEELQRIFNALEIEMPEDAIIQLEKPSSTTVKESNVYQRKDPLAGWKEGLSNNQAQRILSIVAEFGLDFYSSELEPDYSRLSIK